MSERRIFEPHLEDAIFALSQLSAVSNPSDRAEVLGIRTWLWTTMVSGTPLSEWKEQPCDGKQCKEYGEKVLQELKCLERLMEMDHNKTMVRSMHDWLHQIVGKGTLTLPEDPEIELSPEEPDMQEPYVIINDTGRREVEYKEHVA